MHPKDIYNRYYHSFPHYMLTTTESVMLHFFLASFALFVGYGVFAYLPAYITLLVYRSYYYLFGETAYRV